MKLLRVQPSSEPASGCSIFGLQVSAGTRRSPCSRLLHYLISKMVPWTQHPGNGDKFFFQASGRIFKLHQKWAGVPVKLYLPCFERITWVSRSNSIFGKRKISELLRGAGKTAYNCLIFKVVPAGRVRKTSPMRRGLKHDLIRWDKLVFIDHVRKTSPMRRARNGKHGKKSQCS